MRAHDFERAWLINDQVLRHASNLEKHTGPRHRQSIWRGEPFDNARVLVRCYHGLGDTLQFIRFAAPLRQIAREVIVWCQPELLNLVSQVAGVDRVLPLHDGTVDAEFDADVEVMELPYALRVKSSDVGRDVPHLRCVPGRRNTDELFHVGLTWQVSGWDSDRAIPAELLAPLLSVPGTVFHSLQPDADAGSLPIVVRPKSSLDSLAAFMAGLDLIITVDSMTAHLAGGLGLPVWTMLRFGCDWRWSDRGSSTPWYPTMRLFRQKVGGDWTSPVHDAAQLLQRAVTRRFAREHRNEVRV